MALFGVNLNTRITFQYRKGRSVNRSLLGVNNYDTFWDKLLNFKELKVKFLLWKHR